MHYVIEIVSNFDGSILAKIAIGISVSHGIMTGKSGNECYYIF